MNALQSCCCLSNSISSRNLFFISISQIAIFRHLILTEENLSPQNIEETGLRGEITVYSNSKEHVIISLVVSLWLNIIFDNFSVRLGQKGNHYN